MLLEVFYDSWCPVCTEVRHRLERIDYRGSLRFTSIRELGIAGGLGVSEDALEARMHTRDGRGRVSVGIDAVAAISARVPVLLPLWPLLRLSSILGLGQPVYDWIASRRRIVPVGHCTEQGCPVHHASSASDQ